MSSPAHLLEALERAVNEIDALDAIYGNAEEEEDIGDSSFSVLSVSELQAARSALNEEGACGSGVGPSLPLELEVQTSVLLDDGTKINPTLRCRLPPGYPDVSALVTVSISSLRRSLREELSARLTERAKSMIGSEAVMELVEELKQMAPTYLAQERAIDEALGPKNEDNFQQEPKLQTCWAVVGFGYIT